MEKKQLNFSAPLLSARRYSSPLRPTSSFSSGEQQPNKNSTNSSSSDPKLSEVVKPGSVPFQWEHIPGKAKAGGGDSCDLAVASSTNNALRKIFEPVARVPGVKSGELTGFLRGPPPQRKESRSGELNLLIRPQRGGGGGATARINGKSSNLLSGLLGREEGVSMRSNYSSSADARNKKVHPQTILNKDDDEDVYDDVAFSDALEALEMECCYSMNCSTNGLTTASDNRGGGSSAHLTTSSTTTENREFMINRFLPAAMAMTLDSPPHYSSSKRQQPPPSSKAFIPKIVKQAAAAATNSRSPPLSAELNMPMPMPIVLYKGQQQQSDDEDENEEEDDDDDDDDDSLIQPPGQGRYKNSGLPVKSFGFFPWFCSKNALRLVNPVPAMKVKTKKALVSAGKAGKTWVNNASPARAISKHVPCSTQIHKIGSATKSCELRQLEPRHNNAYRKRPVFYSGELSTRNSRDMMQARNGLSPYRNYKRSSVLSPQRGQSPQSSFHHHQDVGFLILPTMVVDQPINDWSLAKPVRDSHPVGMSRRRRNAQQERQLVVEKTVHVDPANINTSRQPLQQQTETNKSLLGNNSGGDPDPDPFSEQVSQEVQANPPAPPPLPKSPSESWLNRSLLSSAGSPRNSFSYSNGVAKFPSRKQSPAKIRPTSGATKWENIVKSSHPQNEHGRYSEELVARVFAPQSRTRK